jgi:hypothetical protein
MIDVCHVLYVFVLLAVNNKTKVQKQHDDTLNLWTAAKFDSDDPRHSASTAWDVNSVDQPWHKALLADLPLMAPNLTASERSEACVLRCCPSAHLVRASDCCPLCRGGQGQGQEALFAGDPSQERRFCCGCRYSDRSARWLVLTSLVRFACV